MANVFKVAKSVSIKQVYERYTGTPIDRFHRRGNVSCPFHDDVKPSFHLYEDTNSFHCFSCKKSGSSIDLYMNITGIVDAAAAAKQICDDFGLTYDEYVVDEAYKQYTDVYKFVSGLYNHCLRLKSCPNHNYYIDRGFSEEVVKAYGLGFCPSFFIDTEKKVTTLKQILQKAFPHIPELVLDTYGLYDSFGVSNMAGRFTFTIKDIKGNPVGFSGRSLAPDQPKYFNTPETEYFHKRNTLYNLDVAKRYGSIIVVEGFCDALTLISQGVPNVVAAMGTAFGPSHIDLLKGKEIILSLDNDLAGYNQMYKIITDNRSQYFRVWAWYGAKDFNDLALSNLDKLKEFINNKKILGGPEFVIKYLKGTLDLSSLEERSKLWLAVVKLIGTTNKHYQHLYPLNTIYTLVELDYYWTIITRIIKGKRGK